MDLGDENILGMVNEIFSFFWKSNENVREVADESAMQQDGFVKMQMHVCGVRGLIVVCVR